MRTTTTGRNGKDGRSGRGGAGRENKKHNTSKHGKHVKNRKNIQNSDDSEDDEETSYRRPDITWGRGRACHSSPRGALIREFSDGRYFEARHIKGEIWCMKCHTYVCRLEELSEACRETLGDWIEDWVRGE
jgi:hypothetical protein